VRHLIESIRGYPRDVQRLLAVSATVSFTIDGVFPVIFNLYILRLGFGPAFVGMVNSVALVVFSLSSLPAGAMGTRLGPRLTLIIGVVISMLSTLALSVTNLLPATWHAWWLIAMFSLLYLGVAIYYVNASPAVVNLTPPEGRAQVISVQSALGNFLAFVGGPMAGFLPVILAATLGWSLTTPATYAVPLIVAAVTLGVAFIMVLRVMRVPGSQEIATHDEPSTERGAPPAAIAFGSTLLIIAIVRFLQATGTGAGLTFFNVYMDDGLGVSPQFIGLVVAASRLLSVAMALVMPWLVRRLGSAHAAMWGGAVLGLSLLPMGLIPLAAVGGLSYVVLMGATSIRYSAFFVYMMEVTPPRLRTMMAGVGEFSGGMSFALTSLVGGLMIVRFGYGELFVASGVLTIAGSVVLLFFAAWRQRKEAASAVALAAQSAEIAAGDEESAHEPLPTSDAVITYPLAPSLAEHEAAD
jgi:MFS family permease